MATGKYLRALHVANRIMYRSRREAPKMASTAPKIDDPSTSAALSTSNPPACASDSLMFKTPDGPPSKKLKTSEKFPCKNPFVQIKRL
jgi:hypothetical protein